MGSDLIGIIPAAGRGTRMGELGERVPKALLEVQGITLLERAVDTLKTLNVSRIVIIVNHLAHLISQYVATHNFDVDIKLIEQGTNRGLAHAIASAADQIHGDFVVLCPDNLYTEQTDLIRAYQLFTEHRPAFVLLTTVQPTQHADRRSYFPSSHKAYAPDLFDYSVTTNGTSGFAVNSTGCVFFGKESLAFLPTADDDSREHIFRDFLESITARQTGMIHVMRGMRYDFSTLEDIESYESLMERLTRTTGKGVSAILMNSNGQVLLQQRDNNPQIRYPAHWALFGGSMEDGESAIEAVAREVKEEIDYDLQTFGLFREFIQNNKREFAFVGNITANLEDLSLSEGQGMAFFGPSQLRNLLIRPDDKETLEAYFGN